MVDLHPVDLVRPGLDQDPAEQRISRQIEGREGEPHEQCRSRGLGIISVTQIMQRDPHSGAVPDDQRLGTQSNQPWRTVVPPLLTGCISRTYAAIFSFWAGVTPQMLSLTFEDEPDDLIGART
jgi:hypothetical protein